MPIDMEVDSGAVQSVGEVSLDVEHIVSFYRGHGRLQRLLHIANNGTRRGDGQSTPFRRAARPARAPGLCKVPRARGDPLTVVVVVVCADQVTALCVLASLARRRRLEGAPRALRTEAANAAGKLLLETGDVDGIRTTAALVEKLGGSAFNGVDVEAVIGEKTAAADARQDRLTTELSNYKTNLIKESIRMGYNDLGDFYYDRNDLSAALKSYVRTRDYCTTAKHVVAMSLAVVRLSLEVENWNQVLTYVAKASSTLDEIDRAKLSCAQGLAHLHSGKYSQAARVFVGVPFALDDNYADVVSPADVAVYGAFAALASMDRNDLRKHVIDNVAFRNFLELQPDVRELVTAVFNSKFEDMIRYMDKLKPDLLLDLHLSRHVDALYAKIRSRALVQYFKPYQAVTLEAMAKAFATSVGELELELIKLIGDGQIAARIDSHNKVLYARGQDKRSQTYEDVLGASETFLAETKASILRVLMVSNDLRVKGGSGSGGGGEPGAFKRRGIMDGDAAGGRERPGAASSRAKRR